LLQTLHRTAGKLIDAVTSDAPLRRNSFDVVFGDHVRQCIKLATNIAMTFGQIGPPKQTVLPWDNAARAVGSWMRLFGPLELGIFCRPPASSRMLGLGSRHETVRDTTAMSSMPSLASMDLAALTRGELGSGAGLNYFNQQPGQGRLFGFVEFDFHGLNRSRREPM